jgi:peroxiredoxin
MRGGLPPARDPPIVGAMLAEGDPAPDFAVGDTTLHRLLERGEAVVFFFPKAFTPG